ncbi:sialate O-acetylesterase [Fibrella arboris]|uniref:sialate O-acetylesterase n=1 Tax=Fibrella arboris TaxID=3242486 RepID=UPI003522CEFB
MIRQLLIAARRLFLIILLCLTGASGWAQRINATTFDKLPQDYQLYPRNGQNEAQIPISGRVEEPGWQALSVTIFRNGQAIGYQRAAIDYNGGAGRFTVNPVTIRAERAEYDFMVYLVKGTDSTLVVNRRNVVAGDVYVLAGQSNASAYFKETRTNEFCRTFGKTSGTYGVDPYNPADTTWALANQALLTQDVGTFGFELQQLISSTYNVPVCLVNAAAHWSMMAHYATRTPNNPADLNNRYGRMLYRLQKGGLDKAVKAFIYRQGESEAYGEGVDWPGNFDVFYKNLKRDLPSLKRFYVYQIDIIEPSLAEVAPVVREAQRVLVDKYADVQVLGSIGTTGFDGLHYSDEGYIQTAQELFWLVARDFYGSTDTDNIDAPNSRRAFYTTSDRKEIILQFNDGQVLNWTDQAGNQLADFFYLNGQAGNVAAGKAIGNSIVLTLKNSSSATRLTYLPPKIDPASPDFPFRGPYMTNKRGLRALSFYGLPIGDPGSVTLAAPVLTASIVSAGSLQLTWAASMSATSYILEINDGSSGTFRPLKQLPAGTLTYLADGLSENTPYTFRIKATAGAIESAWYQVDSKTPAVPGTPVLQATATFATVVTLTWQSATDALGYVVERRLTTEATFTQLAKLPANSLRYVDSLAKDNSQYIYRLKASGRYADSPFASATAQTPALLAASQVSITVLYNNAVQVSWKPVAGATSYQVDRLRTALPVQVVGTFGSSVTAVTDTNLIAGTGYIYRVKAVGDRTASPVASASVTTPAVLDAPAIALTVLFNDRVNVSWEAVTNASAYQLERQDPGQVFRAVGTFQASTRSYTDTTVHPGTTYTFRVKAVSPYSASVFSSTTVQTPAVLPAPALSIRIVYNNALAVVWKPVPNANDYLIERSEANRSFTEIGTFKATDSLFTDTSLAPGTLYIYRITALGNRTESPVVSTSAVTPSLLTTPDLQIVDLSFDRLNLLWKPVSGAEYYLLERKLAGASAYQEPARIDGQQSGYTDTQLVPNTAYQYRLTAYGPRTQSNAAQVIVTTHVLLATPADPVLSFSVRPNPVVDRQTTIHFSQPASGTIQLVDLRGTVQVEQVVSSATQVPLSLIDSSIGIYLLRFVHTGGTLVQKLLVN